MNVGLILPIMELGGDPEVVRRLGLVAEKHGYDHILAGDHPLGAQRTDRNPPLEGGPYDETTPFHDPFVIFSYLAGMTKRIRFVSSVLILPQRQTVLVAKQAADLALVSGDRLTLGIGTGWSYVEYDSMGKEFTNRGKRMNEQVKLLRELWTSPLLTFNGEFESVDRAALVPRPRKAVPIFMGGFADVTFKRAAKIGDGFIFVSGFGNEFECHAKLLDYLREEGRSADAFGQHLAMGPQPLEDAVNLAKRWRDAGGTHASLWTSDLGFTTIDEHEDFAKRAADVFRSAGMMSG